MRAQNNNIEATRQALQKADDLCGRGKYRESASIYQRVLKEYPKNTLININLANCYTGLSEFAKAEKILSKCRKLEPNNDLVYASLGHMEKLRGNAILAIKLYEKALTINAKNLQALNNIAILYNEVGDNQKALDYFSRIIGLLGDNEIVFNNMCLAYQRLGKYREALHIINKAIARNQTYHQFFYNRALTYISLGNKTLAIDDYKRSLDLNPENFIYLIEYKELLKGICDWQEIDRVNSLIAKSPDKDSSAVPPMYNIQTEINPAKNLEVAKRFSHHRIKYILEGRKPFKHTVPSSRGKKIKIGYISSDIREHPITHLMRGVLRCHDKEKFEIFLYSTAPGDNGPYRRDFENLAPNFIEAKNIDNLSLAKKIYEDKIDILIDLNGHTGSSRLETKALKPAPIHINYLGFIGSMGVDFADYIITDEVVTPPDQQQYYTEKFIYMPDNYQANDNHLKISDKNITRADYNIGEDQIVFCSFNQTYKIEPEMFDCWMNILKRVPNSMLWLYSGAIFDSDNRAVNNLLKYAKDSSVDPSRISFVGCIEISEHLKRAQLADIALDTRIYNGGTVTSQTLWAGVPVITMQGGHFASRMASSILTALDMEELITTDLKQYEDLAVNLAEDRDRLKQIKAKITENKKTRPLFDTEGFTKNLEKAYELAWQNYLSGNKPKQIIVEKT